MRVLKKAAAIPRVKEFSPPGKVKKELPVETNWMIVATEGTQ